MTDELKNTEIKKTKELLKNPTLGHSQRASLEAYLKSLEETS